MKNNTVALPLTTEEARILNSLKTFQKLDKGSQNRLRAKVDFLRKTSKAFSEAFDVSISSIPGVSPVPQKESLLGTMKDIVSHPITALKGKIGASMLKKRNKAPTILVYPNPKLKMVAKPINFRTDKKEEIIEIVRKLGAALRGVNYGDRLGMAAPQIGISKRVFVCQGAVCVNPTWTPPSDESQLQTVMEGCYSVPGKMFKVKRWKYGWAKWKSVDGEEREYKLSGINAIVFQHELSHLDGQCCCDLGEEYKPESKPE